MLLFVRVPFRSLSSKLHVLALGHCIHELQKFCIKVYCRCFTGVTVLCCSGLLQLTNRSLFMIAKKIRSFLYRSVEGNLWASKSRHYWQLGDNFRQTRRILPCSAARIFYSWLKISGLQEPLQKNFDKIFTRIRHFQYCWRTSERSFCRIMSQISWLFETGKRCCIHT